MTPRLRQGGRSTGRSLLDTAPDDFRAAGHRLVDLIADYYGSLPQRPLTAASTRTEILELLGREDLPESGVAVAELVEEIAPLLFDHSLHNGHPRFLGYISASAAPVGALADMLAAAVNSNLAKWDLSPLASEIETRAIRWLAELIGYPTDGAGIMVSGGNMANLVGFLAARRAMAPWDVRRHGLQGGNGRLTAYASAATHTWIQKAADASGVGLDALRWIATDDDYRLDPGDLERRVAEDRRRGFVPFIVVATAGTICTGAVDPIRALADFCRKEGIWLHVDGAYGAPAACLPESPVDLQALHLADSVATDPHKWLHVPIEAACLLTRNPDALRDAFGFRPDYYTFADDGEAGIDYYEHGLQNSRGFRALKVWLGMRLAGRSGLQASMLADIALAEALYAAMDARPDFEAHTCSLSITTFRYVPSDLAGDPGEIARYLDSLNAAVVADIQTSGKAFISNAVLGGRYFMRACVVNFRTTGEDICAVAGLIERTARKLDRRMRPRRLAA